jgi:hypothetical protein
MFDVTQFARVVYQRVADGKPVDADKVILCEVPLDMLDTVDQIVATNAGGEVRRVPDARIEYDNATDKAIVITDADDDCSLLACTCGNQQRRDCGKCLAKMYNVFPCTHKDEGGLQTCTRMLRFSGKRCEKHKRVSRPYVCVGTMAPPLGDPAATERRVHHLHINGQPVNYDNGRRRLYVTECAHDAPELADVTIGSNVVCTFVRVPITFEYDEQTHHDYTYDGVQEITAHVYCDCDDPHDGCPCMRHNEELLVAYNTCRCTHVDDSGELCSRFLRTPGTCWRHSAAAAG